MGPFVPPRRLRTALCDSKYLVYRELIPLTYPAVGNTPKLTPWASTGFL
jgi:hypothetical protein